jgi:hypothetical protein
MLQTILLRESAAAGLGSSVSQLVPDGDYLSTGDCTRTCARFPGSFGELVFGAIASHEWTDRLWPVFSEPVEILQLRRFVLYARSFCALF